jgi:ubiquinone/menaquinone biosynthesis C-methylase UbiE
MALLTDVRDISRIGYGFMASKALFAALDLDLFTRLARTPASFETLSADTGVARPRLLALLTACRGLGLIGVDGDGRFIAAPAAVEYLSKSSPRYYGDYFRLQVDRQLYPMWDELVPAMHGAPVRPFYDRMTDPAEARDFSVAQHVGSMGPASMLARRVDASGWRRLLDVAGGTGAFSITLCGRAPGLTATILDFPGVCDVAAGYVEDAGLAARIGFVRGDARSTPWPGGHDAVLMSYLLSAVPERDLAPLLARAFGALEPGGTLVLHDFMTADDRSGPALAALWLLGSAVTDPEAPSLTAALLTDLCSQAGFVDAEAFDLVPGITRALVARKPEA